MKKFLAILMCALCLFTVGAQGTKEEAAALAAQKSLEGQTLQVYCGAGMKNAFVEIADLFEEETGCEMNVMYANAAQIQSQINISEEGDFFIAGARVELKPVEKHVVSVKDLVKHIPVLVVTEGNPYDIQDLDDLVNPDVTFIMGNVEATPIGKIAKKALSDKGIFDDVNIAATTPTAPMIATAIARGEADAAIIWKENAKVDGCEIVDTEDMIPHIKTVPSARLDTSLNPEAADAFDAFLDTPEVLTIWMKYGYEEV